MLDVNWILFLVTALTINAIPGADVIYVTSNYHRIGWKAAASSAIGLAIGYYFYVFITWAGITSILMSLPALYTIIQTAGALYLIWMGYNIYRSKPSEITASSEKNDRDINRKKSSSYLLNGLLISILNPKVGIFFVSFFPQFVHQNSPDYLLLVLGTIFCIGATFFNILYCLITAQLKRISPEKTNFILGRIPGIILIILGVMMILESIKSII
ncbi:LysE family translocator [Xenorhabdus bovienii]|uniref:LysE family translocator n=1 Tax=Xenorhabdus bovienii TaxID=40576 RepID=UPI00237C97CF|nr:LysE family translocator [Xenorhabdus bovienii]MDE1475153.1 LysE family translocator [Xenorhabdus bovienii]MDE1483728.1 LysE family translocator [Xenorhabdus bovienii]MDE9441288.1 LysE family translocator [Xenorhabdus bovienii]MDE9459137.1 LysE family translocator [Xenorhabdus bovienii]MDE9515636.1 LysE family translocator [Xenorhabdus bovienii]